MQAKTTITGCGYYVKDPSINRLFPQRFYGGTDFENLILS